jgi:hypothetical protein
MKIIKDLVSLIQDQQTWIRFGISVVPGIISFFLKVQGNPDALYVGLYTSFFVFVLLVSVHILTSRIALQSVLVANQEQQSEKTEYKYKSLRPVSISMLVILFVTTLVLVFVPPYNVVAKNFVYGTPTPTPTYTLTFTPTTSSTPTLPPTFTSTPTPTSTPKEHGIYYMLVLDASEKMLESFDGKTKWDAALGAINAILESREEEANYGLVVIGGSELPTDTDPCSQPSVPILVFSSRQAVLDYVNDLEPLGGGSIFAAFNLAKDQFKSLPENTVRNLVFITGSSDACEKRNEWDDLERAFKFPGGIGVELYSEIIVLEQNRILSETIEDQFQDVSTNLNVQSPTNFITLSQTNNSVIYNVLNNVTNYIETTIASFSTSTPLPVIFTATRSLTPRPGETITMPPTSNPSNTPTFTPTFIPTLTKTFTPSVTQPPPFNCQSTSPNINTASFGGSASINSPAPCTTGITSGDAIPASGGYTNPDNAIIWVFVYPPNGPFYPQSPNACEGSPSPPPVQGGGGWNVPVYFGNTGDSSRSFDLVVVFTDQAGSDYIGQKLNEDCNNGFYDGISAGELNGLNISTKAVITVQTR